MKIYAACGEAKGAVRLIDDEWERYGKTKSHSPNRQNMCHTIDIKSAVRCVKLPVISQPTKDLAVEGLLKHKQNNIKSSHKPMKLTEPKLVDHPANAKKNNHSEKADPSEEQT